MLYLCSRNNVESMSERYDKADLDAALKVLREGGVILYPTDTVWGIGCDATNAAAVERIYRLKQRADSKSMLCLLDGAGKLQGYVREVPSVAWDILESTAPQGKDDAKGERQAQRPLTIIYPGAYGVADNLLAEDGSLGIRITEEPFSRALCERLHHPLVSTSANISGEPTARCFSEISEPIRAGVDYICQYRRNDPCKGKPSAIIKLGLHNEVKVIRE